MHNLIIKQKPPKCCILKLPKLTMDADFQELAVLPYTSQAMKGTIKVFRNIQHQNLLRAICRNPQEATTCICKKHYLCKASYQLNTNLYSSCTGAVYRGRAAHLPLQMCLSLLPPPPWGIHATAVKHRSLCLDRPYAESRPSLGAQLRVHTLEKGFPVLLRVIVPCFWPPTPILPPLPGTGHTPSSGMTCTPPGALAELGASRGLNPSPSRSPRLQGLTQGLRADASPWALGAASSLPGFLSPFAPTHPAGRSDAWGHFVSQVRRVSCRFLDNLRIWVFEVSPAPRPE